MHFWFKPNERPEAVLLVADNPERIVPEQGINQTGCWLRCSITYIPMFVQW